MTSIGVDIGGTFTDVVAIGADGALRIAKVPSTRSDPSAAVRTVLDKLLPSWELPAANVGRFVHGTTVATNAVLERKVQAALPLGLIRAAPAYHPGRPISRQLENRVLQHYDRAVWANRPRAA